MTGAAVEKTYDSFRALFFEADPADPWPASAKSDLETIFASRTLSFREILALVVFARLLDPTYDPRADFYKCHPRSLFENLMRAVLKEYGVPHNQSPALNIAKAGEGLTKEWAARRRPRDHAQALLRLLDIVQGMQKASLVAAASDLGNRFKEIALETALTFNDLDAVDSALKLSQVSAHLIERHPLGGAVPQWIIGAALEAKYLGFPDVVVSGAADSVSATNRTSGKPGDISVAVNGLYVHVYEVTVKPFDEKRVVECVSSLHQLFPDGESNDMVVIVLCRPDNIPAGAARREGSAHLGEIIEGGIVFEFINIYEWIATNLAELPLASREFFFNEVQNYLNGPRVPAELREYWAAAFADGLP